MKKIFIVFVSSLLTNAVFAQDISTGLKAHYTFNNNFNDLLLKSPCII